MRERYHALLNDPAHIEALLQAGAEKARRVATPLMCELRHAVGLRPLGALPAAAVKSKAAKTAAPAFKQYREKDGKFHFKLLDADARLLLQSEGFESPRDTALAIANLQKGGAAALAALQDKVTTAPGVTASELDDALHYFSAAGA